MKFEIGTMPGATVSFVYQENDSFELFKFAHKKANFKGKLGEFFYVPSADDESKVIVGLGPKNTIQLDDLRLAAFKATTALKNNNEKTATFKFPKDLINSFRAFDCIEALTEGALHASYEFKKYITKNEDKVILPDIAFDIGEDYKQESQRAIKSAKEYIDGIFVTRDLVNEPSNVIYPETLAKKAKEILEPLGVKVDIYTKKEIKKLGLDAYLEVAKGSKRPPRLIVMTYEGNPNSDQKTALVGKGLTYDSGGYSLKPTSSMLDMKSDMAGAATVIGALKVIATKKLNANVVGVVAACENLIGPKSYKPGDIINSLSGKKIEIRNTDAEGRLTLADAVYYATNNLKADRVIDLATLTGACLVALGDEYTGALTNNETFLAELDTAAKNAGEKIWQLPTSKHFKEMNDSKVSDIQNTGGNLAGTITAGLFVGEFVYNDKPWIHLDIAGTSFIENAFGYLPSGATGVQVKTLVKLFE